MAPAGKGTLTIYTEADMDYGDRWRTGPDMARGPEYKAFKQAYADTILKRIESELGIDITSHIEIRAIATPVTHWRYTGNQGGTIMASRPSRQNMKNRVASYRPQRLARENPASSGSGISSRAGPGAARLWAARNPTGHTISCRLARSGDAAPPDDRRSAAARADALPSIRAGAA